MRKGMSYRENKINDTLLCPVCVKEYGSSTKFVLSPRKSFSFMEGAGSRDVCKRSYETT